MSSKLETLEIYRNAVSKTLEKITQTDNIQEVFHDVLTDVLHYYHAGRVAIMQTMAEHPDLQQCIFEVNALGIDDVMDCLGGTFKKRRGATTGWNSAKASSSTTRKSCLPRPRNKSCCSEDWASSRTLPCPSPTPPHRQDSSASTS